MQKLKNKLLEMLNKIKPYCQAQMFYLRSAVLAIKEVTVISAACLLLGTFVVISALAAESVRDLYIDQYIAANSLMVKSPIGAKLQGSGTGFEIQAKSGKTYTITNGHVCGLAKDGIIMVEVEANSARYIPRRVLEVYEKHDLCLIEGMPGYSGLKMASEQTQGEHVWSIGYPMGQSMNVSSGRVKSLGHVEIAAEGVLPWQCKGPNLKSKMVRTPFGNFNMCVLERTGLMTDVSTFPGNSGSPLVNIYGRVVGVIFASDSVTHWGVAVPLSDLKDFLDAY